MNTVSSYFRREAAGSQSRSLVFVTYIVAFWGILPLFLGALGLSLDRLIGWESLESPLWKSGGIALLAAALAWMGWSALTLWRFGAGLPISHLPPVRLVTAGPFAIARHPIYVGYIAATAAAGAIMGSPGVTFASSALVLWGAVVYALCFEELRLRKRHPDGYPAFAARTPPFLLPRSKAVGRVAAFALRIVLPPAEWIANRTVFLRIGPAIFATYGLLAAIGAGVMASLLAGILLRDGVGYSLTAAYALALTFSILGFSKVMWLFYNPEVLRKGVVESVRTVGLVSWGGFAALFGTALVFASLMDASPLWLLDRTLLSSVPLYVLGRIGCLAYGCCYGRVCESGIRYHNPLAKVLREQGPAGSLARVPTQLLSAFHGSVVLLVLLVLAAIPLPAGTLTAVCLLLYGLGRFTIDHFRDSPRHGAWELTSGQQWAAGAAVLGALLLLVLPRTGRSVIASTLWPVDLARVAPLAAVCAGITFVIAGLCWRKLGRW
jgi:phosphatidylglycerol:prolipoprotein diacylglycerol transferase